VASGPHGSSSRGLSELLSRDNRLRAETPGTWPAQICNMRTRRCAMVARKSSTCRKEQRRAVRQPGVADPAPLLRAIVQVQLGAKTQGQFKALWPICVPCEGRPHKAASHILSLSSLSNNLQRHSETVNPAQEEMRAWQARLQGQVHHLRSHRQRLQTWDLNQG
jgi:hypothetical protein